MNKFTLKNETIERLGDDELLPDIPIMRAYLDNVGAVADVKTYAGVLNHYRATLKELTLISPQMTSERMRITLSKLKHLEKLTLVNFEITSPCTKSVQLPMLTKLTINSTLECTCIFSGLGNYNDKTVETLKMLIGNASVEQLAITVPHFCRQHISNSINYPQFFTQFIKTLPNVKHLSFDGPPSFLDAQFPLQLDSFVGQIIDTHFLETQVGCLRELRLDDLKSAELVRIIFEDMHLESFYMKKAPLILHCEKQDVTGFIGLLSLQPGLELLKHAGCMKF
jgi:hypothetical protein